MTLLLVNHTLELGGIETFYIRLAKYRYKTGKKTTILLLTPRSRSNPALISEAELYAEVYFATDYFNIPRIFDRLFKIHLILIYPLNIKKLKKIFRSINHIHFPNGLSAFLVIRILKRLGMDIPVSIGLYHSREFCWGKKTIPKFEKYNREIFLTLMRNYSLFLFNESMKLFHEQFFLESFEKAYIFPIGVIEEEKVSSFIPNKNSSLKIVSVGRLVDFKAYNIWMLDIVKKLKSENIAVIYDIYGEGPLRKNLESKIKENDLQALVNLRGKLDYSLFDDVVSKYDLFVGSGTAIVESSHLGIPSLVGVESVDKPISYGFFSEIPGFSYNEDGLFPKVDAYNLIKDYLSMDNDKKEKLSIKHIEKAQIFSMSKCNSSFEASCIQPFDNDILKKYSGILFRIYYSLNFFFIAAMKRIIGRSLIKDMKESSL